MKVFINAGHAPNGNPDPGAVNQIMKLRECDITKKCADLVEGYLTSAGVEVVGNVQDDSLDAVCSLSNARGADLFVSIHCNSASNGLAEGTETFYHAYSNNGKKLAQAIQAQIVESIGMVDRGVKGAIPGVNGLYVLNNTDAVAVLVELGFISNTDDAILLRDKTDDFARAIARGVTDYEVANQDASVEANTPSEYQSKYFKREETECHCGCGGNIVEPLLLQKLDQLREMIGGPLYISCAYRCPAHNAEVGGVENSQHTKGTAADVQVPNYDHCNTPEQLAWYCEQIGFDGIGIYDWGCHVDVRDGGKSPNTYRW